MPPRWVPARGPSDDPRRLGLVPGRRQLVAAATFIALALAFMYIVVPQLPGVQRTWERLNSGNLWWIGVALVLEIASMASYVAIFRGVHVPEGSPITFLWGPIATFNVLIDLAFLTSATACYFMIRRFVSWWPAAFAGSSRTGSRATSWCITAATAAPFLRAAYSAEK